MPGPSSGGSSSDDCNRAAQVCEKAQNPSDQLKSYCDAKKQAELAHTLDKVMTAFDGGVVGICGLACVAEKTGIGAAGAPWCNSLAMLSGVGDMTAQVILYSAQPSHGPSDAGTLSMGLIGSLMSLGAGANGLNNWRSGRASGGLGCFGSLAKANGGQGCGSAEDASKDLSKTKASQEIAEKEKKVKAGSCMAALTVSMTLVQRGLSLSSGEQTVRSACANVNALTGSSPDGFNFGAGSSGGGVVSPVVGSTAPLRAQGSSCDLSCALNSVSQDQALQGASLLELAAASAGGGLGPVISHVPSPDEFVNSVAGGNAGRAVAGLFPPGSSVGAALGQAAQESQSNGIVLPGVIGESGIRRMSAASAALLSGGGGVSKSAGAEGTDPMMSALMEMLNRAKTPEERSAAQTAILNFQKNSATDADIFHNKTPMNLFEIVSKKILSVSGRIN